METTSLDTVCGPAFSRDEIVEINKILSSCQGLTCTELGNTVCELLSWRRHSGRLKTVEYRQVLEYPESKGVTHLPGCKKGRPQGTKTKGSRSDKAEIQWSITGKVGQFFLLLLSRVEKKDQRDLWDEYIDRYHYIGYQLPFGPQLRYLVETGQGQKAILGCLQFSSPAWGMAPKDRWIQWNDEQRERNLEKVINSSRYLILAWVRVKYLARSVLALAARQVPDDWKSCYTYRPVLMEALVAQRRFKGSCYKAANWVHICYTTGRRRMDRWCKRKGTAPKESYPYPLTARFWQELLGL